ncbi:SCO-spondin-like [Oopsacas minuta]|uniref:SCO-spondin-like n=1 Tax=Oopsacas minuta TaxID=111878 RepID=A0AAV7JLF0_9METZ|nr:SCO-spondin-like [Oopsacas minuta]
MRLVLKYFLILVLSIACLQVSAECDFPDNSTKDGFLKDLVMEDSRTLVNSYHSCSVRDQNNITKYTYILLTLEIEVAGAEYYARLSLNCSARMWKVNNMTDTISVPDNPPVFLDSSYMRVDCYECNLNFSPVSSDLYGCMECHDDCLRAGVNNSLGYCYGQSASECCSYSLDGMCVAMCPLNYVYNNESACVCAPNRSGPDCSNCDLICQNGTAETDCSVCNCDVDYFGTVCESQYLPCLGTPCQNGGLCIDGIGDNVYTCDCNNMWEGTDCATCPIVCQNGGTPNSTCNGCNCINSWGGFDCSVCGITCENEGFHNTICTGCDCVGNWGGGDCDTCELSSCLNNGSANSTCNGCNCINSWEGFDCSVCGITCENEGFHNTSCTGCDCVGNWGGGDCDTCELSSCLNGGTANSTCNGCNCINSWEGFDCSVCGITCENEGFHNTICTGCDCVEYWEDSSCTTCGLDCKHGTSEYSNCTGCQCPRTLTGDLCDQEADLCSGDPCGITSNCTDLTHPNTYECDCDPAYILIDQIYPVCVLDDACDPNPCDRQFSINCLNVPPHDYKCICVPDITAKNCSEVIDNCIPDPCVNGLCMDGNATYICECTNSFQGMDCDVCNLTCGVGSVLNSDTCECDFTRIPCGSTSCDLITEVCDVDHCICNSPAFAEGIEPGPCFDNDECLGFPCHEDAICTNAYGSYTCVCKQGFMGDGIDCTDINECSFYYPACGQYPAVCMNIVGGFNCVCPTGYSSNNLTQPSYCYTEDCKEKMCVDINECATPDLCGANQKCENILGGYFCECLQGFFPTGSDCTPSIDGLKCPSTLDGTGTVYPDTPIGITIRKQCPNTLYGVISRTCIPPCECTADQPVWGYSNANECVSQNLFEEINQLRRLSIRELTDENILVNAINEVWRLTDDSFLLGKDLEIATIFIHEVELVIRDWPTSMYSLSLSEYGTLLNIADYLLSKSAESWEETDNSTANILSIIDTIRRIGNRISISIYDNSDVSYTFQGNSFFLKLITWDEYTTDYFESSLLFPENTNHFMTLPYMEVGRVSLPGTRTPNDCKTSLLLLQLTSVSSLLSTAVTGGLRRNQCIDTRIQTPRNTYQFIGDSISMSLTQGICQFVSITDFPTDSPLVFTLPNSPDYQISKNMFFNTKLFSLNEYSKSDLIPYTQSCEIQTTDDDVISFHCTSFNHYIPLLISPVEGLFPTATLVLTIVIKVILALSSFCCLIALILLIFKIFQMRKGLVFVRFNVIFSIMIAFIVFLAGIDRTEIPWVCSIFAGLMQYFAICTTLWSLLDVINVILIVTRKNYFIYDIIFFLVGYLVPIIPIAFSVGFSLCSYIRARLYCWPSSETNINVQFAISAPLYLAVIVLIVLIVVLLFTSFKERAHYRDSSAKRFVRDLTVQLSSITLPVVLIITWILAAYAFDRDEENFGSQICFIVSAGITGIYCLFAYSIASSEKFRFYSDKIESDSLELLNQCVEPNTTTTNISRARRESIINPIYSEDNEMKRASTGYSKTAVDAPIKELENYIRERETTLISSRK